LRICIQYGIRNLVADLVRMAFHTDSEVKGNCRHK
jgi:hypothetical protein